MYGVFIVQPMKTLSSTAAINKCSSAAATCNSTSKIVPLLTSSDKQKLYLIRIGDPELYSTDFN